MIGIQVFREPPIRCPCGEPLTVTVYADGESVDITHPWDRDSGEPRCAAFEAFCQRLVARARGEF